MPFLGAAQHPATPGPVPPANTHDSPGDKSRMWDGDGFDFGDILDVVNPLQHIPVISTLYREITGDEIGYGPRVAGGGLYGGVLGLVASLFNVMIEDDTGKDLGGHAIALLFGDGKGENPDREPTGTLLAQAQPFVSMGEGASEQAQLLVGVVDPAAAMAASALTAAPPQRQPAIASAMNDSLWTLPAPESAPDGPPPAPAAPVNADAAATMAALEATFADRVGGRFDIKRNSLQAGLADAEVGPRVPTKLAPPAGQPLESRVDAALALSEVPGSRLTEAMRHGLDRYAALAQEHPPVATAVDAEF